MIQTKDLEGFMGRLTFVIVPSDDSSVSEKNTVFEEYRAEIIKRLQAYDGLKNGIENLIKTLDK